MEAILKYIGLGFLVVLGLGSVVGVSCWAAPKYNVYSMTMEGEAELKKAEFSKRVAVQTAQATRDSASMLAEAEVARANGVAQANKIIGDSLKDNEAYLRYLWIHSLEDGKSEVIYVPTEANLPILEATRRHHEVPAPVPTK